MLLRFIGRNGSMGLTHGKNYNVSIRNSNDNRYIYVEWMNKNEKYGCPYSSPQSFAANWESAR